MSAPIKPKSSFEMPSMEVKPRIDFSKMPTPRSSDLPTHYSHGSSIVNRPITVINGQTYEGSGSITIKSVTRGGITHTQVSFSSKGKQVEKDPIL